MLLPFLLIFAVALSASESTSSFSPTITPSSSSSSSIISSAVKTQCPCVVNELCRRRRYGSSPLDVYLYGQLRPCINYGYVRCCYHVRSTVQTNPTVRSGVLDGNSTYSRGFQHHIQKRRRFRPRSTTIKPLQEEQQQLMGSHSSRDEESSPFSVDIDRKRSQMRPILVVPANIVPLSHSEHSPNDNNVKNSSETDQEIVSDLKQTDTRDQYEPQNENSQKTSAVIIDASDSTATILQPLLTDVASVLSTIESALNRTATAEFRSNYEALNFTDHYSDITDNISTKASLKPVYVEFANGHSNSEEGSDSAATQESKGKHIYTENQDLLTRPVEELKSADFPHFSQDILNQTSISNLHDISTKPALSKAATKLTASSSVTGALEQEGGNNTGDVRATKPQRTQLMSLQEEAASMNHSLNTAQQNNSEQVNSTAYKSTFSDRQISNEVTIKRGETKQKNDSTQKQKNTTMNEFDLIYAASDKKFVQNRDVTIKFDENVNTVEDRYESTDDGKKQSEIEQKIQSANQQLTGSSINLYGPCPHELCSHQQSGQDSLDASALLLELASARSNYPPHIKVMESSNQSYIADTLPVSIVYNDNYSAFLAHCVYLTQCQRWYGSRPNDEKNFGFMSECPRGQIRCLDGLVSANHEEQSGGISEDINHDETPLLNVLSEPIPAPFYSPTHHAYYSSAQLGHHSPLPGSRLPQPDPRARPVPPVHTSAASDLYYRRGAAIPHRTWGNFPLRPAIAGNSIYRPHTATLQSPPGISPLPRPVHRQRHTRFNVHGFKIPFQFPLRFVGNGYKLEKFEHKPNNILPSILHQPVKIHPTMAPTFSDQRHSYQTHLANSNGDSANAQQYGSQSHTLGHHKLPQLHLPLTGHDLTGEDLSEYGPPKPESILGYIPTDKRVRTTSTLFHIRSPFQQSSGTPVGLPRNTPSERAADVMKRSSYTLPNPTYNIRNYS